MPISRLKINQLRNLQSIDLEFSPKLNLLFGPNGAGKTSLLEAISVLAHGRSFRTVNYRQLVQHECDDFAIFAEVDDAKGITSRIGVHRPMRGQSVFKVDGSPIYSSATLAALLPLQVINAKSFDLLEGPAKVRRRMFDWLVFHVKHSFSDLWRDYTRAVKQRNTLLRRDKITRSELHPWDIELNRLAVAIDALRAECFEQFTPAVAELLAEAGLPDDIDIQFHYERGWSEEFGTLSQALDTAFERDKKYKYTTVGAHKSELKVAVGKQLASDILSRGQQKSVVAACNIAELKLFETMTARHSVLVIDDLPAELDDERIACLGRWLQGLNTQVFVTGIHQQDMLKLKALIGTDDSCRMFHVKHGTIEQTNP